MSSTPTSAPINEPSSDRETTIISVQPDPHDDSKKAEKRRKDAKRKQIQRKRTAAAKCYVDIPTACHPEKYSFYNAPTNTISHSIFQYLSNLQKRDVVARPVNWSAVLHDFSVRQKNKLSLSARHKSKLLPQQHVWNKQSLNHYCVANTDVEFQTQLDSGLFLPVVILPQSELSSSIARQSIWSGQPLEKLLDEILKYTQATIPVQDHSMPSLDKFTITKTCEEVRARFHISPEDRGCPWNCADIKDWLFGFKGPKPLENGANLQNWQLFNPDNTVKNLSAFEPVQGAKLLDEWLLVSEKNSGSTAHVDVGYATWVSCLAGKKTFWVRNPSIDDLPVWLSFDIGDDHRAFVEPWARIDLYPGSTLVFPPGTVYVVYTEEDSVFCGGHFLTPGIMDRFLRVLGQLELRSNRSNDTKSVDLFQILENFIVETLFSSYPALSRPQLHRFILALEDYLKLKPSARLQSRDDQDHLKKRKVFIAKVQKKDWVALLKDKASSMSWENS